ncbi:hypothetical protein Gotur_035138 [Gossypium turneri]
MAESKSKFESIREWVVDHKLRTVGVMNSVSYMCKMASSCCLDTNLNVRLILLVRAGLSLCLPEFLISTPLFTYCPSLVTHCHLPSFRLHAQALTLAALAGAAVVEYYDHRNKPKADPYAKYLPHSHKE